MEQTQQTKFISDFFLLPEKIKSWLSSEEVVDQIVAINARYSIFDKRLPFLAQIITRFSLRAFPPEALVGEIQKTLNLPAQEATKVAGELKLKVFAPIAEGLKTVQGIDVNKIPGPPLPAQQKPQAQPTPPRPEVKPEQPKKIFPQAPGSTQAVPPAAPSKKQEKEAAFQSKREYFKSLSDLRPNVPKEETKKAAKPPVQAPKDEKKPPVQNPVQAKELKASTPRPFMLHEERPQATQEQSKKDFRFELPDAPKAASSENKQSPQAQTGDYFQGITQQESKKPAITSETKKDKPKVVHYSAYRTLLDNEE